MDKSERITAPDGQLAPGRAGYRLQVCEALENQAWDRFVAQMPEGHHVQTSLWGRAQAQFSWRPVRVIARQGDEIVAGAQILMRAVAPGSHIGSSLRGPLMAEEDPDLARLVVEQLVALVRAYRIRHLTLQPGSGAASLEHALTARGFRPGPLDLVLPATVLVDLSPDLEAILARMQAKTRYNIRLGQRKGITVREGTADDIGTFYRLLVATSQRQQFVTDTEAYFAALWDVFAPRGLIKLFLAECEGEVVSAFLNIAFGDTVIYKRGAWSGQHGNKHPNEALHWAAMAWAKAQGYRHYDFDGIPRLAADLALQGQPLSPELQKTVAAFKLGFGGRVVLLPPVYEYVANPILRWGYYSVFPRVKDAPLVRRALRFVRSQIRRSR